MTREEAKKRLKVWLICMDCPEDKLCYDSYLHSTCEYTDYCDEVSICEAIKAILEALSSESCDDAISRKDAVFALNDAQVEYDETYKGLGKAKEIIDNLPPVQPTRPKGEWIRYPQKSGIVVCNQCKGIQRDCRVGYTNFCNKCGADMRGEKT